MAGNNYKIKVSLSDGSVKELPFTAPEGPRGPKGDCRGVSVHEVKNTGEFYDLLAGLSSTQKVFAVVANGSVSVPLTTWQSDVQIVRLVQMKGALSIAFQYAFQKDPGAGGAAVEAVSYTATLRSGGTDKFTMPGSTGSTAEAASLSVYVYDSETPPPSYLDLPGDARFMKQSVVPKLRSFELSIAASNMAGKFGLGSYVPHGTEYCLLYYGDDPSPMTLATVSEGSDGNYEITPVQTLAAGTEVSCGDLLYKVTQGICKAGVFLTNIWECVKPISCRFEYCVGGNSLTCQNMQNVDVTFTPDASEAYSDVGLHIRNCRSMSVYCATKGTNRGIEYNGFGINSNMMPAQASMAKEGYSRPISTADSVDNTVFECHLDGAVSASSTVAFPWLKYHDWHLYIYDSPKADSSKCYSYISGVSANDEDKDTNRVVDGADGAKGIMQFCPVFDVSSIGLVRLDGYAYYEPAAAAAAAAKARAVSVQAKPVEPNVPEDAVGMFSVDEHGNTINAMTGEVLSNRKSI